MFRHKHSPSGVASTEPQGGSAKCKLPGCGRSRAHLSGRPVARPAAVRLLGCSPDAWRLWDWPLASLGFQPCGRGEMPRCTVSTSACGSVACLPPGLPAGSRSTRAHGRDTQGRCLPGWAPWGLERAGAASAAPVIACARGLAAAARRRQEAPGRARAPAQGNRRAGGGHGGHPTRSAPRPSFVPKARGGRPAPYAARPCQGRAVPADPNLPGRFRPACSARGRGAAGQSVCQSVPACEAAHRPRLLRGCQARPERPPRPAAHRAQTMTPAPTPAPRAPGRARPAGSWSPARAARPQLPEGSAAALRAQPQPIASGPCRPGAAGPAGAGPGRRSRSARAEHDSGTVRRARGGDPRPHAPSAERTACIVPVTQQRLGDGLGLPGPPGPPGTEDRGG